jgi:flagellar biosynthesis chaperone FliJ
MSADMHEQTVRESTTLYSSLQAELRRSQQKIHALLEERGKEENITETLP